jgi:hypothetical protein
MPADQESRDSENGRGPRRRPGIAQRIAGRDRRGDQREAADDREEAEVARERSPTSNDKGARKRR